MLDSTSSSHLDIVTENDMGTRWPALSQRQLAERRAAVANSIRQIRKSRRMTQQAVAARLDWSRSSLAMIETGRQQITIDQLFNLASLFECGVSAFFPIDLT